MPLPHLDNLVRVRHLRLEAANAAEIRGLIRSGTARLRDAQILTLSLDSRFDLAYNAAHALALAALRWHGYRSEHRFTVFQCLEHTVEFPPELWRVLEYAHRRRNVAEYEGHLDTDLATVDALIDATQELAKRVSRLGAPRS